MATGRTKHKWWRVYADGYDLSGFSRNIGPLQLTYDEAELTADMGDTVKGYLPNNAQAGPGTLNAVFDNTATVGLHALSVTPNGTIRNLMVPIGIRGAPAQGDPCFGGQFTQTGYQVTNDGGAVTATLQFAGWAADASTLLYSTPWGILLHENVARLSGAGANAADGFDNPTGGATTKGGFMIYQVLATSGAGHTATISVDDGTSAADADMDPLAGCTTGSIAMPVGQCGVIVPTTLTIRQFLRFQIAFGTATSLTWVCAFMRKF